jgi:hypothetical protein
VCLFAAAPGDYDVTLVVDDGVTRDDATVAADGQTAHLHVTVADDRPPCMDGFDPAPGQLYLLDRGALATFAVTEVLDDLDGYPGGGATFAWSLWRGSDPVWRPVPHAAAASLTVDPTLYAVDELVEVRAQALDRVARTPACDPSALVCTYQAAYPTVPSCYLGAACDTWVTWEARFR